MTHGSNEEPGKLFVGGLSWETTQENLQRYFCRFGEVVDVVVMKNNESGRSRGFGFVTFKDPECVSIVLASGPHELDGRTIDPKSCNPRGMSKVHSYHENKSKRSGNFPKIFLGGLPSSCTETDLRNFFAKYGKVGEIVIMYDQERKKSRGFGFLSFENEDTIDRVCAEHYVIINGKQVECKRAEPRNSMKMGGGGQHSQGQWGSGMMGSSNWGAQPIGGGPPGAGGPAGGPGQGMPNGMMPGYQSGWGAAPQQQAYGAQGNYGTGYQGWGSGYPPYGAAAPQYGQQGYGAYGAPAAQGYGGGYGGYPPAAPGGQVAGQTDAYGASGTPAGAAAPTTPGSKPEAGDYGYGGMGNYQQDSSNYGPARGYGGGNNPGGNVDSFGAGNYGQDGSASHGGGGTQGGGRGQSQGYHPYRR